MKNSLLLAAAFVLAIILVIYLRALHGNRATDVRSSQSPYPAPVDAYVGLRTQIFHGARASLQLPPDFPADEPWAIVMDWGVQRSIATVVAVQDGTASMYYSTGGGNIGGGQAHESLRSAAKNALAVASKHVTQLRLVTEFPVPTHPGQVYFYVLTDSGVYFGEASQGELASDRHPLSDLGNAMQAIVTGYRLNQK